MRMDMHASDLVRKMPNSSSTLSVYMHHSPYDHDHTPRNEEGTRRHHGYVRMRVCRACHVMRARDRPFTEAEAARLLTTGLCRDTLCALPALRRFEANVWKSAYASMKNAQGQVKDKHCSIPTKLVPYHAKLPLLCSRCWYTTDLSMVQLEPIACVTASCRKPHRRSK